MADHNRAYKCWLDPDGRHVWQEHECLYGTISRSILPNSKWSPEGGWAVYDGRVGVAVVPSIDCHACWKHEVGIPITAAPEGFTGFLS